MMKIAEIYDLTTEELESKLNQAEQDLIDLKIKNSLNQLDNPLMLRQVRRDIAKIKTVLREKGIKR